MLEAAEAEGRLILPNRRVDSDPSPFLTALRSDFVHEGEVAGRWPLDTAGGEP